MNLRKIWWATTVRHPDSGSSPDCGVRRTCVVPYVVWKNAWLSLQSTQHFANWFLIEEGNENDNKSGMFRLTLNSLASCFGSHGKHANMQVRNRSIVHGMLPSTRELAGFLHFRGKKSCFDCRQPGGILHILTSARTKLQWPWARP